MPRCVVGVLLLLVELMELLQKLQVLHTAPDQVLW
jgi:hypothetical protein